jgi:hypothetical protein
MSLVAASSVLRRYQLDLHCAGFETALFKAILTPYRNPLGQ